MSYFNFLTNNLFLIKICLTLNTAAIQHFYNRNEAFRLELAPQSSNNS